MFENKSTYSQHTQQTKLSKVLCPKHLPINSKFKQNEPQKRTQEQQKKARHSRLQIHSERRQSMKVACLVNEDASYSPNGGTLSIIASTVSSLISSTQNQLLPHPNLTTTTIANSVISNITFQDIPYSPELYSFSSSLLVDSCDVCDSDRFLYCGFVDLNQASVGRVNNASLIRTSANMDYTNTQFDHWDINTYQTVSNTKASGLKYGCFFIQGGNQLTLQTCLFDKIERETAGTVVYGTTDNPSQAVFMKNVICTSCNSKKGQGTIWTHLGTIKIEDSEFRACEAEGYGGAIRVAWKTHTNPLFVTNTVFSKCGVRSGPGGAISAKINGRDKTRIVNCIFEYCYCPGNGAALDLWEGEQFRDLHIYHFTNTGSNVQTMFKVDGGSLSVIHSGSVACSELSITGLTFIGAKLIETTSYSSLSVTDSDFASLTSETALVSLKKSSSTTTFTSTNFTDVSASSQPIIDIDIAGTVLFDGTTKFENPSPLSSPLFTASSSSKVQFSGASLLSVTTGSGMIETKVGTVEIDACLVGPSTQTAIEYALLTAGYTGSTTTATLNIISSTFKNIKSNGAPALSVSQKGVVSMSSCVVESASTMSSSLFSVMSGGQLTINTHSFASISSSKTPIIEAVSGSTLILSGPISSSADPHQSDATVDLGDAPLLSSSSALTMNAFTISNFKSTSPLIVLTPTSQTMTIGKSEKKSQFETIKSSSAGGSAINAVLSTEAILSISSTDFLDCSSTNGNGGAVSVSIVSGTFTVESSVSFKKCASSGNGGALFMDLTGRTTGTFSLDNIVFGSGEDANRCTESGQGRDLFMSVKKGDLAVINSASVKGDYFSTPADSAETFSSSELSKFDPRQSSILSSFNSNQSVI
ncbi:hypothetical protein BLNAU_20335 [Blattamonas nauphoetae]|uniref:Polymorphic outer membrane protein n=1 Tax=Blattamonas nauphoetae TaxID=2049346 RepID=A0ABQ9WZ07_9EUKA|nr:hypothetical protein BLNAU_20335 [Blattamonas nauphoetae]